MKAVVDRCIVNNSFLHQHTWTHIHFLIKHVINSICICKHWVQHLRWLAYLLSWYYRKSDQSWCIILSSFDTMFIFLVGLLVFQYNRPLIRSSSTSTVHRFQHRCFINKYYLVQKSSVFFLHRFSHLYRMYLLCIHRPIYNVVSSRHMAQPKYTESIENGCHGGNFGDYRNEYSLFSLLYNCWNKNSSWQYCKTMFTGKFQHCSIWKLCSSTGFS